MNKVQNVNILYLKATYTNRTEKGKAVTIAIPLMPEFLSEYKLSKNKRKSNITLPPFSLAYPDILFE